MEHIIAYLLIALIVGCAALKQVGRTANDAAKILCELTASEQPEELDKLTPEEWCSIHKNLSPFLDEILSAKQRSEDRLGFSRKETK